MIHNTIQITQLVRIRLFLCVLFVCVQLKAENSFYQQTTLQDSLTLQLETFVAQAIKLDEAGKSDELKTFLQQQKINTIFPKIAKDSMLVAELYYYKASAAYQLQNYLKALQGASDGLPLCPKLSKASHITGSLYYMKSYAESKLGFGKRAINTMKTALDFLVFPDEKNNDLLVDAYVFLSSQSAYYGNLTDAKRYIRLANTAYTTHKKFLDKARKDRYEVVLKYREIYLLSKFTESKEDSLALLNTMHALEKLHQLPSFNTYERIYYITALNHVGTWYLSRKADSLITQKDVSIASSYIDKSIDLHQNKHYPGNYFMLHYNKAKALNLGNKTAEAETLMLHLLDSMSKTDPRKPFFLAQKALIKANLGQKDSALHIFHQVIEHVHTDTTQLTNDYHNFKPSKVYGEAKLISRVAEKLNSFYGDDPEVQKTVSRLYYLAFVQFENSYVQTKFNPVQNELLRKIVHGLLTSSKSDANLPFVSVEDVLSRTEAMMNQMTWQRFYQNRNTNNLPELDALNYQHLQLRTQLTYAKQNENVHLQDSIQELINKHIQLTNSQFPNYELVSSQLFDVKALQKEMPADELILKYLLFEHEVAIFSVTSETVSWTIHPWKHEQQETLSNFTTQIKNRNYSKSLAAQLATYILPKIDENITKIVINPDGELYKIPFEALQINDKTLAETFEVRYTSNLKFIYIENQKEVDTEKVLAVYAPVYEDAPETDIITRSLFSNLEGAKTEASVIGKLFPSKIYMGEAVSKQYFLDTAHEADLLHLAMHAEINDEEAGLSRLLFKKNATEADNLYLEELYALHLQADMAVLSACNTGVGKENAGRSMESFQRAFTFAGVPATVASLWEVPDQSTSEIMESFYMNLHQGASKSVALQQAKLDYIQKHKGSKLAQPYYWAGFVLYGDQTAVAKAAVFSTWQIALIIVLILMVLFFVRRLRN